MFIVPPVGRLAIDFDNLALAQTQRNYEKNDTWACRVGGPPTLGNTDGRP
jgi:hypothetical protein